MDGEVSIMSFTYNIACSDPSSYCTDQLKLTGRNKLQYASCVSETGRYRTVKQRSTQKPSSNQTINRSHFQQNNDYLQLREFQRLEE
eukprot:g4635.t1